jgi:tripartite-type tricarboxylate transporter receptor subunit TctC
MLKLSTYSMRALVAAALMMLVGVAAAQQAYPGKPIRFIVPYPPGGTTDPLARLVAQQLSESWGQPVLVENRPGGNTIIGSEALLKSPADGYTLFLTSIAHVIIPSLIPLPYDAIKDFAAVGTIASNELVLVVHPSVPAKTLQELVALAKAKPGQLNYASPSTGTINHLAGELLAIGMGLKLQHVPYKGSGPAMTDLLSGQIQMYFAGPIYVLPFLKSEKVRAIAISGESRVAALPQVPTFSESGLPGFEVKNWVGVAAPAATPRAIIDKLSAEIARILATPEVKEKLVSQGMDPFISTADQAAALMKTDLARFAKVIKSANIKLEN